VAYLASGLLDTMTLGAKPVAALFGMMGLVGAVEWLASPAQEHDQSPTRRATFAKASLALLPVLLIFLAVWLLPGVGVRNLALGRAHRALYSARQNGAALQANVSPALRWVEAALRYDGDNPQLYGAQGSLLAWNSDPAAAVEALRRRVLLDSERPLARYAPFLLWQRQLTGMAAPAEGQDLLHVYSQWRVRFPERAEGYVLSALALELQMEQDPAAMLQTGLEQGAMPSSLLTYYLAQFNH
jgi:hypothetical protein